MHPNWYCLEATEAGNDNTDAAGPESPSNVPLPASPLRTLLPQNEPAPLPPPCDFPPPAYELQEKVRMPPQAQQEVRHRMPLPQGSLPPTALSSPQGSVPPSALSSPQLPRPPPKLPQNVRQPSRQQSPTVTHKHKQDVDITDFLDSHRDLLDHLSKIRGTQVSLRQWLEDLEQKNDQEMTDLLKTLQSLVDVLHKSINNKEVIYNRAQEDFFQNKEQAKAKQEVVDKVVPYKGDKIATLEDIDKRMEEYELHFKKTKRGYTKTITPNSEFGYSSIPEVEVTVLVKSVTSVDTAAMSFEVSLEIYLVWDDPLVHEKFYSGDSGCKNLRLYDWKQFFNPNICIENGKGIEMRTAEVPSFAEKDKNGNPEYATDSSNNPVARMTKKVYVKGKLGLNAIDLSCFPFDMQVLPIVIRSEKTSCLNKNREKKVRLVHPRVGKKVSDSDSRFDCVKSLKGGARLSQWGITVPLSTTVNKDFLLQSGHCVLPEIERQLVEFDYLGIRGTIGAPSTLGTNLAKTDAADTHYEVKLLVERPFNSSYLTELVVLTFLVAVASLSFWDTAAPEISSRLSITLTVLLTLAAYTGERPVEITKTPKLTFQDRYEVGCFFLVVIVSLMNVISATVCGGEHPEAPEYMTKLYHKEACQVGWCGSRLIDCTFFLMFTLALVFGVYVLYIWVRKSRMERNTELKKMTTGLFVEAQQAHFRDKHRKTKEKLDSIEKENKCCQSTERNRQRCKYVIYVLLAGAILGCGISLEGDLRSPTKALQSRGPDGWFVFALSFAVTSLHFIPGQFLCLVGAGYTFGLEGLVVSQIGTAFSASLGYFVSQFYRERVRKGIDYFPAYISVYLEALLAGHEFRGWRGFINICALRNNIEVSFGWVNALVAIGHAPFLVFILATVLSMQPQIVLWVSIGMAIRAMGSKAHSGWSSDWSEFSVLYLCIIGSWMVRLGLGCIGRHQLHLVEKSHRSDTLEFGERDKGRGYSLSRKRDKGQGTGLEPDNQCQGSFGSQAPG